MLKEIVTLHSAEIGLVLFVICFSVITLSHGGERVRRDQNLETRVSFAVMNSSSAGLPAFVCSIPR